MIVLAFDMKIHAGEVVEAGVMEKTTVRIEKIPAEIGRFRRRTLPAPEDGSNHPQSEKAAPLKLG